jgi:dynein heavy chain
MLQDVNVPIKWLSDLFDKYLPNTIFEMKKSFSHITPLGTMNFVTVGPTASTQSSSQT